EPRERRVDQAARDAELRRNERQVVLSEPAGVEQLLLVDPDLAVCVPRREADHQRMRERPRLAAEVADVCDLDPDLLADLAGHSLLQRLARLDEARERAVEGQREVAPAGEQDLASAPDERDDGG